VIRTFLHDFHIGRVECVTCHVPLRKSTGGILNSGLAGTGDTEGARKTSRRVESVMMGMYSTEQSEMS
jgi:hypothetical protein